jgi:DNA invertase Pin-like site-specific DNA recombinase
LDAAKADLVLLDIGSGGTTARPRYQQLLELIGKGEVTQILVVDQDRLNRNLANDIALWELCESKGTRITDLHGREIEFRTPDGELMSITVSALNQHKKKVTSAKTKLGMAKSREAGLPTVSAVPFGIKKVFKDSRLIALDVDPELAHYARQRVEKFLEIGTLNGAVKWINRHHPPEYGVEVSGLRRWLTHPCLTGRLCHSRDRKTEEFSYIADKPSFEALISDATAERVSRMITNGKTTKALAGRHARPLTGLCRCADCGNTIVYKRNAGGSLYLRCTNARCAMAYKTIREELVTTAISLAVQVAAEGVAKMLARPEVDPPAVKKLISEIAQLKKLNVSGLEEVILSKEKQIASLRSGKTKHSAEALALAVSHPKVWLQSDQWLNRFLHSFIDMIHVKLRPSTPDSRVCGIHFCKQAGCNFFEEGNTAENGYYVWMLLAQELAVQAKYKGWTWPDLAAGYLPALRSQLADQNAFLDEGGLWPEMNDFATRSRSLHHGRLSGLSKIQPRLNELWAELTHEAVG